MKNCSKLILSLLFINICGNALAGQQDTLGIGSIALTNSQKSNAEPNGKGLSNFLGESSLTGVDLKFGRTMSNISQVKKFDANIYFSTSINQENRSGFYAAVNRSENTIEEDYKSETFLAELAGTYGIGSFDLGFQYSYFDMDAQDESNLSSEKVINYYKDFAPQYALSLSQQLNEHFRYTLILLRNGMTTSISKTKKFEPLNTTSSTEKNNQNPVSIMFGSVYKVSPDQMILFGYHTFTDPENNTHFRSNIYSQYNLGYQQKMGNFTPRVGYKYIREGKKSKSNSIAFGSDMTLAGINGFFDLSFKKESDEGNLESEKATENFAQDMGISFHVEKTNMFAKIENEWESTKIEILANESLKIFMRKHTLVVGAEIPF